MMAMFDIVNSSNQGWKLESGILEDGCLFVLTNLRMLEFNISVLNFEDMHDMDVAEVDGGLISLKLRKQTDLSIRKFSFSRMTTGSAVGKGTEVST